MPVRRTSAAVLLLALAGCSGSASPSAAPSTPLSTSTTAPAPGTVAPSSPAPSGGAPSTGAPSAASSAPPALDPVVPSPEQSVPAVPVGSPAAFGNGVTARLTRSAAVTTQGEGVGQVVGAPAVAVTLEVTNGSPAPLSLRLANVTATYGPEASPGVAADGPPGAPLPASLAPGATASGVYLFAVPLADRGDVTVTLSYDPGQPTVVFTGRVG